MIATGFYLTILLFRICWQIAVKDRRLSVAHLLTFYFTGMWLGGYYMVGAIGMILLGIAQKVMVSCENTMRENLIPIFSQQPRQVWVVIDDIETEIFFTELRVGDILVLDVGQMAPIDGVIVQGMASIDQHMLTGAAQPIEKGVVDLVLGGRIHMRVVQKLQLAHKLDNNIAFNFKIATLFSLLSGGSILFLPLKYIAVEVLAASQLLTGVGIASKPLLETAPSGTK